MPVLALVLLPSNVVSTTLPLLQREWSASATEMGWVFAAYQLGYVASVLFLLPLTDRVPAGWVIVGCAVGATTASLLFPLAARDVGSAAALRAIAGAGLAGVYLPGVRVVAAAAAPARRGLLVGLYVSAFYLGTSLSLLATGVLLDWASWRQAAVILGVASAAAIPIALWPALGQSSPAGSTARLRPSVLRDEAIARTIGGYAGHSWELYVSRGWLAAYLAGVLAVRGAQAVEASANGGKWAALIAGLGVVGVWAGGWLSDRWGRARTAAAIAAASGLISLGFGWLGAGVDWALLVAIGCVYGIVAAADSAIYSTAITELAPAPVLGSAQAAQASIGFLASTVAPIAAGAVLDLGGGFGGAFMLAGAASLLGAAAVWPLARRPIVAPSRPG